MKTNSTYTIENELTGQKVKASLSFSDVRKFAFIKNQKSKVAASDYRVIDEITNEYFPLSQIN